MGQAPQKRPWRGCRKKQVASQSGTGNLGEPKSNSPGLGSLPALVSRSVFKPRRRELLKDYRNEQERWAIENQQGRKMSRALGMFIATLAAWDWFINPLSFRDRVPGFGPPVPGIALSRLNEFLTRLQRDAGQLIGWVIAEELGRLGACGR